MLAEKIIGVWELQIWETVAGDSVVGYPLEEKASGFIVGHPARLPHSGLEQDAGVFIESEKGTFPLKTFQFDFAKRTDRKQFSELCVRGFAQRAPLA